MLRGMVPRLSEIREYVLPDLVAQCQLEVPMTYAPLIIRWGADASSDVLRECAKCSRCGYKGATLQHPSWAGADVGWMPFPNVADLNIKRDAELEQYRFSLFCPVNTKGPVQSIEDALARCLLTLPTKTINEAL